MVAPKPPLVLETSYVEDSSSEEDDNSESVALTNATSVEELSQDFTTQQKQLDLLRHSFMTFKEENNKKLRSLRNDRFEGIKKDDVMTMHSCQWFTILGIGNVLFLFIYYFWRKGSESTGEGDIISTSILQVSLYSMVYLSVVLFDIFCQAVSPDRVRCPRNTANTVVIVAAHRAHDSLEQMLPTVLQTFSPGCVWVADNGYRDKEAEALCRRLGVNYEYNEVGNKANALVVVARKIKRRFGDRAKNVVLLDDDTELPHDFFVRHDLLADPTVGGYCVAIAVKRESCFNIWEIAIDFEYRAISHAFAARAADSSMRFCHGICAVYKLDLMLEMYTKNWSLPGGLPFGEDGYAGLEYRAAGYRLVQDNANIVLTFCPRRFFPPLCSNGRVQGYGASCLWKQRACRWFLAWPRQLPMETWLFFTYNTGTVFGNFKYRVYFFWWLFINCVSVGWIPYMIFVWVKKESWFLILLLKGMLTFTGVLVAVIRILAFPPKLRRGVHPLTPLCSPILGMANTILRFFAFLFSIYWFIPYFRVGDLKIIENDDSKEKMDLIMFEEGSFFDSDDLTKKTEDSIYSGDNSDFSVQSSSMHDESFSDDVMDQLIHQERNNRVVDV